MAITKRSSLNRPLTSAEMDANIEHLEAEQARTATTGSNYFAKTQHISGSEHYISGSNESNQYHTIAIRTSGSILPNEGGVWDIGSEENPFRDLWITSESLKFSSREIKDGS